MFVDQAEIFVRSGKGGDGVVSFRREKYVPKGGPDGGDGGDGGSVYLVATAGVDTLLDFSGRHHWNAQNGQPGRSKQRFGANGDDLEIRVPPGTLVYDADADELIEDLAAAGQRLMAARGGRGGFGNEHFKSATNQTPRQSTPGDPAQQRMLRLELKLIADIGLIGKPNAGKSTLLSRISNARPKIANYPFTTLEPNLGIAQLKRHRRIVVADIPGLIEGASDGLGLGNQFLRHIERTRCLVHLLGWDPFSRSSTTIITDLKRDYETIHQELAGYSTTLVDKSQIVVLNKIDLASSRVELDVITDDLEKFLGRRPLLISAATGEGLGELLSACWDLTKANNDIPTPPRQEANCS